MQAGDKGFPRSPEAVLDRTAAGGWRQDFCIRKRMAFVSHPHPTLPRFAGESAWLVPVPNASLRCATAVAMPSPRARGPKVRGSAGAAAAVTAGSFREMFCVTPRDRID
jgi:hypothetical protein